MMFKNMEMELKTFSPDVIELLGKENKLVSDYQKLMPVFSEHGLRVDETLYEDNVKIGGSIIKSNLDKFTSSINEISSARAKIKIIQEKFDF